MHESQLSTHPMLSWLWACAVLGLLLPQAIAAAQAQGKRPASAEQRSPRVDKPPTSSGAEYTIRLHKPDGSGSRQVVEVRGLSKGHLSSLAAVDWSGSDWNALLGVYVAGQGGAGANRPAVLGTYHIDGQILRFTPRFPFEPGLSYRAVFHPGHLPEPSTGDAGTPVVREFKLPPPSPRAAAVVEHVYPSADRLPENQLKFYIHFSAPMSRGEAYRRVRLLDACGQEIDGAFLELGEELWDPMGMRFTLFIDPGRIKRGLKPREDLGPVLEQGNAYTLLIDGDWHDAAGNSLARPYRKRFQVGAPDEEPIDVASWKIDPASAGTRNPITVAFPEPLDHAMLQRVLVVTDSAGNPVPGIVEVKSSETRWQFTPDVPWQAGRHNLVVDTVLEDLAGNSIGRPFEVDVFRVVERQVQAERVAIPFKVSDGAAE